MVEIGYAISSEEQRPEGAVRWASAAEQAGFPFALISDHYHPWTDSQGQSGFVWGMIGAIAQSTSRLRLGTGVTCPLIRIHPAVIAQAAATSACLMPGRFFLGVGTGEALNEHITGEKWPPLQVRQEMLEEAIDIIRELWSGELTSYRGGYYTVENARIYSLPEGLPPIFVAASGTDSASLAGETGDGLIGTAPKQEVLRAFEEAGGGGKPRYGQVTVCWAEDEATARRTALEWWPTAAVEGQLSQELALPQYFEAASSSVTEEQIGQVVACGPDPQKHIEQVQKYVDAGYDHVYVHQVGPDQAGFLEFYRREVLPQFGMDTERRPAAA